MIAFSGLRSARSIALTNSAGVPPGKSKSNRVSSGSWTGTGFDSLEGEGCAGHESGAEHTSASAKRGRRGFLMDSPSSQRHTPVAVKSFTSRPFCRARCPPATHENRSPPWFWARSALSACPAEAFCRLRVRLPLTWGTPAGQVVQALPPTRNAPAGRVGGTAFAPYTREGWRRGWDWLGCASGRRPHTACAPSPSRSSVVEPTWVLIPRRDEM